jgi:hypothetical protein
VYSINRKEYILYFQRWIIIDEYFFPLIFKAWLGLLPLILSQFRLRLLGTHWTAFKESAPALIRLTLHEYCKTFKHLDILNHRSLIFLDWHGRWDPIRSFCRYIYLSGGIVTRLMLDNRGSARALRIRGRNMVIVTWRIGRRCVTDGAMRICGIVSVVRRISSRPRSRSNWYHILSCRSIWSLTTATNPAEHNHRMKEHDNARDEAQYIYCDTGS